MEKILTLVGFVLGVVITLINFTVGVCVVAILSLINFIIEEQSVRPGAQSDWIKRQAQIFLKKTLDIHFKCVIL